MDLLWGPHSFRNVLSYNPYTVLDLSSSQLPAYLPTPRFSFGERAFSMSGMPVEAQDPPRA